MNIFVNMAAGDPASALVAGVSVIRSASSFRPVIGDQIPINLYLVDGAGGYDSRSGDASYSLKIGIGPLGGVPSGGAFTLSDGTGGGTTGALNYSATAAQIQTALNALHTNTGPYGGLVTVTGDAPTFQIAWNANGAHANLTGSAASLTPNSAIVIDEVVTGDGATAEVQMVRLRRVPAAFQDTWTPITNGWTALLNVSTFGIADLLGEAAQVATTFEIELTDGSGNRSTIAQSAIIVRNEVIDEEALVPTPTADYATLTESRALFVLNKTALTGLTGGGTALDGIVTASGASAVGHFLSLLVSGNTYFYRLEAGTDAEASPTVIRPDDYDGSTNAVVWKLKGIAYAPSASDTFTYEVPTTITGAGATTLAIPAQSEHHSALITVTDTYGGGTFTCVVVIPTTDATAGDVCELRINFPASIDPVVEVRNSTSGGTLLTTLSGQSNSVAIPAYAIYKFNGTAWVEFQAQYVD